MRDNVQFTSIDLCFLPAIQLSLALKHTEGVASYPVSTASFFCILEKKLAVETGYEQGHPWYEAMEGALFSLGTFFPILPRGLGARLE